MSTDFDNFDANVRIHDVPDMGPVRFSFWFDENFRKGAPELYARAAIDPARAFRLYGIEYTLSQSTIRYDGGLWRAFDVFMYRAADRSDATPRARGYVYALLSQAAAAIYAEFPGIEAEAKRASILKQRAGYSDEVERHGAEINRIMAQIAGLDAKLDALALGVQFMRVSGHDLVTKCYRCGATLGHPRNAIWADLNGPAFQAYCCNYCKQVIESPDERPCSSCGHPLGEHEGRSVENRRGGSCWHERGDGTRVCHCRAFEIIEVPANPAGWQHA